MIWKGVVILALAGVLIVFVALVSAEAQGWFAQIGLGNNSYPGGTNDLNCYLGAAEDAQDSYGEDWDLEHHEPPSNNYCFLLFRGDQDGDDPTYPERGLEIDTRAFYSDGYKVWKIEIITTDPGYTYDLYYDYQPITSWGLPDGWVCKLDMDGEITPSNYTDLSLYEVDLGHRQGYVLTDLVQTGGVETWYLITGPALPTTAKFRFYVDKNSNGRYDAGEGVDGAEVYFGNRLVPVAQNTQNGGYIEVERSKVPLPHTSVFARKKIYSRPSPRGHHEDVDNIMYDLWLDSDIGPYGEVGAYFDRHLMLHGNWQKARTGQEVQIPLGHPVFEWNLTIAIEGDPRDQFIADLKKAVPNASDRLYDVTDGQMKLGKVAIYKNLSPGSPGWTMADVLIHASDDYYAESQNGAIDWANTWPFEGHIHMGRKNDKAGPEHENFYAILIHEFGHYALQFYDEYMSGHGESKGAWWYRNKPWGHPEEFPYNYGVMQWSRATGGTELSSFNDYLQSYPDWIYGYQVTKQIHQYDLWWGTTFRPCWDLLEHNFNKTYDGWPVKLIAPPYGYWDSSDPKHSTSADREGPTGVRAPYEEVRITAAPPGGSGDPSIQVTWLGEPVAGVSIVLFTADRGNMLLGRTNEDGMMHCEGIMSGDKVRAYWQGRTGEATYSGHPVQIELSPGQEDILGVVIDADVVTEPSPEVLITVHANRVLAESPAVTAYPHFGEPVSVPMTLIGDSTCEGKLSLEGVSIGGLEVLAEGIDGTANHSYGTFALCGLMPEDVPMCYGYDGATELSGQVGSVLESGASLIFETTASPPMAGLEAEELVGEVLGVRLSNDLESTAQELALNLHYGDLDVIGLDETQLALMWWNWDTHAWEAATDQPSPPDNVLYHAVERFGIFCMVAPTSDDVEAPALVVDLSAESGATLGRINLEWTAPGDDDDSGTAVAYELRCLEQPITEDNWDQAPSLPSVQSPGEAGTIESYSCDMDRRGVLYYFALRTVDEAGNRSGLSNVASAVSYAPDTDDDGMPDFWETSYELDPGDSVDANLDGDEDGLTNLQEYARGTNPLDEDTDGDGARDGDEVAAGTDPLDYHSYPGPETVPPETVMLLEGALGQNGWYVSNVTVTLSATDEGGGVAGTEYSLDGGLTWIEYSGSFIVSGEGETIVLAYSTDNAGNVEDPPVDAAVWIDKAPPVTTISIEGTEGTNGWYVSDVIMTLTAADEGSGVAGTEYSLDGGMTWIPYTGPFIVSAEGETTILAYSTDNAGNIEDPAVGTTVNIDKTIPEVSAVPDPHLLWPPNHEMVQIDVWLEVADNLDPEPTVELVSVDSDEPDDADGGGDGHTSPDTQIDSDGTIWVRSERDGKGDGRIYTITYRATDAAGNWSQVETWVYVPHDMGEEHHCPFCDE